MNPLRALLYHACYEHLFTLIGTAVHNVQLLVIQNQNPVAPTTEVVPKSWWDNITYFLNRNKAAAPVETPISVPINAYDIRTWLPTINTATTTGNVARIAVTGLTTATKLVPIAKVVSLFLFSSAGLFLLKRPVTVPRIETSTNVRVSNNNRNYIKGGNSNSNVRTGNMTVNVPASPISEFGNLIRNSEITIIKEVNFIRLEMNEQLAYLKQTVDEIRSELSTGENKVTILPQLRRLSRISAKMDFKETLEPNNGQRDAIMGLINSCVHPNTMEKLSREELLSIYKGLELCRDSSKIELEKVTREYIAAYSAELVTRSGELLPGNIFGVSNRENLTLITKTIDYKTAVLGDPQVLDFRFLQFSAMNDERNQKSRLIELSDILNKYSGAYVNTVRNIQILQDNQIKHTSIFVFNNGNFKGSSFDYHVGNKLASGKLLKIEASVLSTLETNTLKQNMIPRP